MPDARVPAFVALLAIASHCTAEAPAPAKPATPAPATPTAPTPPTPPPAPPVVAEPPAPPPPPTLAVGPDRYDLPLTFRGCERSEIFCGVHIVDLASKKTTTLITRDQAKTWAVRANKKETPVPVTLVAVPPEPRAIWGKTELFPGPTEARPTAELPSSGLELWHDVAAVAGDKFYAIARKDSYEKIYLYEIAGDGKHQQLELGGGWPQLVYPYKNDSVAIYTVAKRHSLDLYEPAKGKVETRIPIDSDVDKECAKLATETEPDRMLVFADRAYVMFDCVVIGD